MPVVETAHAKVNLFLHVVGRRADGYHLLDSLAVFPEIGDRLTAAAGQGLSLALTGPFGVALTAEPDNLVLRAARALAEAAGIRADAHLTLEKNLPIASGIGGGSADAAAALRALATLWNIAPTPAELARIAVTLGADVPVCLTQTAARMGGVGEMLTQAPNMPASGMVLVNPGVAVPTPSVFRARTGAFSPRATLPEAWADPVALAAGLAATRNDLEPPASLLAPVITEVLAAIAADPACLLARMSGSGATCFGLFADAAAARQAEQRLAGTGWWVWGGSLPAYQEEDVLL